MKSADLLIDARGAEIQHRSGLTAPDPFIYLALDGQAPMVFFDAREFQVMKAQLEKVKTNVAIEHLEPYLEKLTSHVGDPLVAVAAMVMQEQGITEVRVSGALPYILGQQLEATGLKVVIYDFAGEREHKTQDEIQHLIAAQRVNESAFLLAWQMLSDSTIRGNLLLYRGQVLTSEVMKLEIRKHLLDQGYDCPDGIIVASGEQTAQPHHEGSGPLLPHACIIVDIFPRSQKTGFFADMTRTFVKGEPSSDVRKLFQAVEDVQRHMADWMAVGQLCSAVHQETVQSFERLGHPTSFERGFMHGTGHSLGLSLHEYPCLNARSTRTIESGMVFTVEPGLYYPGLGGVRIEDVVIFHPDGRKENITSFSQPFFIA